jgi:hypothetical protein
MVASRQRRPPIAQEIEGGFQAASHCGCKPLDTACDGPNERIAALA